MKFRLRKPFEAPLSYALILIVIFAIVYEIFSYLGLFKMDLSQPLYKLLVFCFWIILLLESFRSFAISKETNVDSFIKYILYFVGIIIFCARTYSDGNLITDGSANFDPDIFDGLYFSIVTWTTLGYGDLYPVGLGKFIAAIEALSGYIFTALLVVMIIKYFNENKDKPKTKDVKSESIEYPDFDINI